jgi:hypothetical protein
MDPRVPNPSKRRCQRRILTRIMANFRLRFEHPLTVMCLPGRSNWDVDFFLTHPEVGRIIAVERDPEVAAFLREKNEGNSKVEVFEGSTTGFLGTFDGQLDICYLDYFSNFCHSVELDIRILFRRRLMNLRGKVIVAFLGSREIEGDQIQHRMHFEDLDHFIPSGESWEDITTDRRRCIAFNALVARFRIVPVQIRKQGDAERFYVSTGAPVWRKYPTLSGDRMFVGWFAVNAYPTRATIHALHMAPDGWFVRGNGAVKFEHSPKLYGVCLTEGPNLSRDFYKFKILEFYEKNHYTPTVKEIGVAAVKNWTRLVRQTSLCPRCGASLDDVQGEVQRIFDRDGVVTWSALHIARLTRRKVMGTQSNQHFYKHLIEEMGLSHSIETEVAQQKERRRVSILKEFVEHLEAGKPKTQFRVYSWVNKHGFTDYGKAVKAIRSFEKRVAKGLIEDVTSPYTKKCIQCGEIKSYADFPVARYQPDGLGNRCNACI